ncbi:NUDIX hydrolase [Paraburkholderia sp. RAU6.4a]|uniref:NUDIX hydrolase n=1 Tax=Paraburkholderia sp. RAU6.4a TaxID=2991067 RepID=UPI003D1C7BCB
MSLHQVSSNVKDRATIVCRQQDHILLVTRGMSRWSLPGGTIRRTESPMEAAKRELVEETALDVDGLTYLFEFGGLTKRHHVFFVDLPEDAEPQASNEIARCHWFRPKRVSSLITSVPTRGIVELIFRHNTVTI